MGYSPWGHKESDKTEQLTLWTSQEVLVVKNLPANARDIRDPGSILRLGRLPWRRKWQPTAYFAWRTPWAERLGRLQSMGLQRVGHDWTN